MVAVMSVVVAITLVRVEVVIFEVIIRLVVVEEALVEVEVRDMRADVIKRWQTVVEMSTLALVLVLVEEVDILEALAILVIREDVIVGAGMLMVISVEFMAVFAMSRCLRRWLILGGMDVPRW